MRRRGVTRRTEDMTTEPEILTAAADEDPTTPENSAPANARTGNSSPQPLLYKYVTLEGLRHILRDSTIRFTQPSAFNDPFELLPEIIVPTGTPEGKIQLQFDISSTRPIPDAEEIVESSDGVGSSDAMSREIVQLLNKEIGILCLSRVRDSLLMWSHYGDQYAGAVVGFDSTHEFLANQIDVEYRSTRPRRHVNTYLAGNPVSLAELCAKSKQWEYEQEVRVVRRLAGCKAAGTDARGFPVFVQHVPREAIKIVIIGERTPLQDQRAIYAGIMETPIALSLLAVDHQGFAFREERIKFNVPFSKMMPMISPRTAHIFADMPGTFGELARALIEKHPMSKIVNLPT
jgi:hypothetical protein